MTGPFWEFLTDQYVRARRMEVFSVARGPVSVWVPEIAEKPAVMEPFDICVAYNHGLYVREPDGKAWRLRR